MRACVPIKVICCCCGCCYLIVKYVCTIFGFQVHLIWFFHSHSFIHKREYYARFLLSIFSFIIIFVCGSGCCVYHFIRLVLYFYFFLSFCVHTFVAAFRCYSILAKIISIACVGQVVCLSVQLTNIVHNGFKRFVESNHVNESMILLT